MDGGYFFYFNIVCSMGIFNNSGTREPEQARGQGCTEGSNGRYLSCEEK